MQTDRKSELDSGVHFGAGWCIRVLRMPKSTKQKRFTVSLDAADYESLRTLAESQQPSLNLQYVVRLAVRNLLDQYAANQLSFPLDRR